MSELSLLLRVLFAAGLSAFIGYERERHGRPAGLRTHILVAIGAALVMAMGEAIAARLAGVEFSDPTVRVDPGRLAAGVITGIGFLGAGTIIRTGDWVRGLTTAASLWFVAAIGLVAGGGYYQLALGGTVIGFLVLSGLNLLENRITSTVYRELIIEVSPEDEDAVLTAVREIERDRRVRCTMIGWEQNDPKDRTTLRFLFRYRGPISLATIGNRLSEIRGVFRVRFE